MKRDQQVMYKDRLWSWPQIKDDARNMAEEDANNDPPPPESTEPSENQRTIEEIFNKNVPRIRQKSEAEISQCRDHLR